MTFTMPAEPRPTQGAYLVSGEPLIFHCHHYNVALQKAVEEGLLDQAPALLTDAAQETAYALLEGVLLANPTLTSVGDRLKTFANVAALLGFGRITIEADGRAHGDRLHYAFGWKSKYGTRTTPGCFFHAGFTAAAFDVATGSRPGTHTCTETSCGSVTGGACTFSVEKKAHPIEKSVGPGKPDTHAAPPFLKAGNVDGQSVVAAVSGLPLGGNEEGLIPAFGVYLTRHLANYYNRISYGFEYALQKESPSLVEAARLALIEAGHICAFHTFGGIAMSAEWEAVVAPMCKDRADWFHGMVAVANALGWGCWRTVSLDPGKRVEVDIFSSYESNGHLAMHGKSDHGACYLATGGIAGFMNLLWVGDITQKPRMTEKYYAEIYSQRESFVGEEIRCRSKGDDRCTIVAERKTF